MARNDLDDAGSPSVRSQLIARRAREDVVRMTHVAGASHVGSSLSCIDILAVIYGVAARVRPDEAQWPERDIVLVSKGHAAAAVYATLCAAGFFPHAWLEEYCTNGSPLGGHVTAHGVPGVELSTGSLGHALPFAVGTAIAAKRDGTDRRAFVLLSDGELDEGSNWEAALLAAHHQLGNLTVVIDRNGLQSLTTTEETVALEPLDLKWTAFGWDVQTVDGHDHDELTAALSAGNGDRPRCVIAKTIKGRGVPFMENQVLWHYRPPSKADVDVAVAALAALDDPRA